MLNEKVVKMLNDQVQKEFYSAYLYLAFANHFDKAGLDGFANWYTIQAMEEKDHAMLFVEYMHNNGLNVDFQAIEKPELLDETHSGVLKQALDHERYVTASINAIYSEAALVKDYRTMQFLDWFVKEQGEEEKNADSLVTKFELFGKDTQALYGLNTELAARTYAAPDLVLD